MSLFRKKGTLTEMKQRDSVFSHIRKIEDLTIVRVVRSGLLHIIPVLIIGAFSLILQTFPVSAYQTFISDFADGFLLRLFEIVYHATFGVLSVYMTFSVSRSYMHLKQMSAAVNGGAVLASLLSFFILAGAYLPDFGKEHLGPKSMFLAIVTALGASCVYLLIYTSLQKKRRNLNVIGGDRDFSKMTATLVPIAVTAILFALFNAVVIRLFDVDCCRTLLINAANRMFRYGSTGFLKGFFFVMLSSVLWFFGVHGSDTLEGVMQTYFAPNLPVNQAAVAAGNAPTQILTKEFFDCFVLMGGCGSTICLLIAILLFSRNRPRRKLGLAAAFPMLFNINELMVFGLPIIFNPIMLVPFLAVPLLNYSISYAAMAAGVVPLITSEVAWTTPILLGGYTATGSLAGSVLQFVNVIVGVLVYLPFVRLLDKHADENARRNFDAFLTFFKENEPTLENTRVTELGNMYGDYAKDLCNDLRYGYRQQIRLAYQPQYHYDGHCIGVEALMRYEHPIHGVLYPPLVIKLAQEGGFLPQLEELIWTKALEDRPKLLSRFGDGIKLSVNVTGTTVVTQAFIQFCRQMDAQYHFADKNICIEITEQAAISFGDETLEALHTLREMGLLLAIDDFSMGHTSIRYLLENLFDVIKLDGSLVNGLATHSNTYDIISSIVQLSASLNLTVLAEFVDTEEKRSILHEIGCDCYQGYLYSPAVFLD